MTLRACTPLVLALAVAVPASAMQAQTQQGQTQQGQTPPKPEPKPEAKPETAAAPGFAGKWTMNIESPNGSMQSALEVVISEKDPKKVTGTLNSQMGETKVEGEIADGKLTFWITIEGNNMSVTFVGAIQKDGSMAGMLNFGQGEIPWTAVRVKG